MAKSVRVPYGLLSDDEQAVFRRVVSLIGERLLPEDETAVEALARALVRYRRMSDLESHFERLAKTAEDPEVAVAAANSAYKFGVLQVGANKQVMHALSELGLSPAARKRIGHAPPEKDADAILEFLKTA